MKAGLPESIRLELPWYIRVWPSGAGESSCARRSATPFSILSSLILTVAGVIAYYATRSVLRFALPELFEYQCQANLPHLIIGRDMLQKIVKYPLNLQGLIRQPASRT